MRIASTTRPTSVHAPRGANAATQRERVQPIYETKSAAQRADTGKESTGAGVYEATFYVLDTPHAAAKRAYSVRTAPRLGSCVDIRI